MKLLFKKTVLRRADPGRPQFRFSPGGTAEAIEPSPRLTCARRPFLTPPSPPQSAIPDDI